jgi:hypothetical protein
MPEKSLAVNKRGVWVPEFGIDIITDEIEKGRDLGKSDSLGVGFVSLGEAVHRMHDQLHLIRFMTRG